jgi:hypothetical protein
LNGPQGCGKNAAFFDVLAELAGYCNNVIDIEEICEQLNTGVEGNLLVVCNEMRILGERRFLIMTI